jgi:hypothetical protein
MSIRDKVNHYVRLVRPFVPALLAASLATGSIAYGVLTDDPVTVLGALLLVPSAVLLFGIGFREGRPTVPSEQKTN